MLFINKLFNSIACLLSFTNLQLVIPGRTWILLYLGRTVYKCLWASGFIVVSQVDLTSTPTSTPDNSFQLTGRNNKLPRAKQQQQSPRN